MANETQNDELDIQAEILANNLIKHFRTIQEVINRVRGLIDQHTSSLGSGETEICPPPTNPSKTYPIHRAMHGNDRRKQVRDIVRQLLTNNKQVIVIAGFRRTGKSTLIEQCITRFQNRGGTTHDMMGPCCFGLDDRKIPTTEDNEENKSFTSTIQNMHERITGIETSSIKTWAELGDALSVYTFPKPTLIALDELFNELNKPNPTPRQETQWREFKEFLQKIKENPQIKIIFSTPIWASEKTENELHQTIGDKFSCAYLKPFTAQGIRQFIRKRARKRITPTDLPQTIHKHTLGVPLAAQCTVEHMIQHGLKQRNLTGAQNTALTVAEVNLSQCPSEITKKLLQRIITECGESEEMPHIIQKLYELGFLFDSSDEASLIKTWATIRLKIALTKIRRKIRTKKNLIAFLKKVLTPIPNFTVGGFYSGADTILGHIQTVQPHLGTILQDSRFA